MNLLLTLVVGLFFLVGIILTKVVKNKGNLINYSVSLALVVLLGLICLDLIPEIREIFSIYSILNTNLLMVLLISCLGFCLLLFLDYLVPSHSHDHHDGEKNLKEHNDHIYHIGLVTLFALMIHNIIEGMAIFLVTSASISSGLLLALGVSLHNIPLGIEISATMLNNGKKKSTIYLLLLSLSSFVGGLIVMLFGSLNEFILGYIMAFSLGMCIYISVYELLGETIRNRNNKYTKCGIITGILIVIGMLFL